MNDKRLSTQELLQIIYKKIDEGFTEFEITGSGQHNIGGPLWTNDGQPLEFNVKNPGQRVGSMGMPGTRIVVNGSAPADVGWLNSGAEIIVKAMAATRQHIARPAEEFLSADASEPAREPDEARPEVQRA